MYYIDVELPDGSVMHHLIKAESVISDADTMDYTLWDGGVMMGRFPCHRVISIVRQDEPADEASRVYPEADASGRLPGEPDYGDPRPVAPE